MAIVAAEIIAKAVEIIDGFVKTGADYFLPMRDWGGSSIRDCKC